MGKTQRSGKTQTRTVGRKQGKNYSRKPPSLKGVLKMNVTDTFPEFKEASTHQIKSTTAFLKLRVRCLFDCVRNKIKTDCIYLNDLLHLIEICQVCSTGEYMQLRSHNNACILCRFNKECVVFARHVVLIL